MSYELKLTNIYKSMKNRIVLLLIATILAIVSVNAETPTPVRIDTPRYVMKATESSKDGLLYTTGHFYRLDSRTGRVDVVEWKPDVAKTKVTTLGGTSEIDESTSYDGRFELNVFGLSVGSHTLILLDTKTGDTFQRSSGRSDSFTKIL